MCLCVFVCEYVHKFLFLLIKYLEVALTDHAMDACLFSKKLSIFQSVKCQSLSRVRLSVNPWTVAHQAPLTMGILQARILE